MTKAEFEERIVAMQDTLYRVSATILHQPCDREDAIQDSILKALKRREQLRSDEAMRSWVIRILINECYTLLRRAKRERPEEALPERVAAPDADPEVFRMLFSLEEALRLPMVLYYVEGYSVKEISRILRVPQGTIKSRMHRARERMRIQWKREEEASGCHS